MSAINWRFRKTFKVLPGVRLNVSKSGISTSIGSAPFTLNVGRRGIQSTASIPGTSISLNHRVDWPSAPSGASSSGPRQPLPVPTLPEPSFPVAPVGSDLGEEIRSA